MLDFKNSIKVLDKVKRKIKKKDKTKFQYIEARCLEELDKKEEAVIKFQKIIVNNARNPYSKYSNRRIFLMGTNSKKNTF